MTETCVACHGRLPAESTTSFSDALLARVDQTAIAPFGRARLQAATRQFDRALASYEYRDLEPGPWLAPIASIQQTARLGAAARTLPLAAAAVAAMAGQCGDCHRRAGYVLDAGELEPFADGHEPETLAERMQRHVWAADRMWEALVMPSEHAWLQGASALASSPSELSPLEAPLSPKLANALVELRALGARALDARDWTARIDTYANLLVSCSSCHSSIEVL